MFAFLDTIIEPETHAAIKLEAMESDKAATMLREVVSLLGATCGSVEGSADSPGSSRTTTSLGEKLKRTTTVSVPCLSLDKDNHEHFSTSATAEFSQRPRDEAKSQASCLLARPICWNALQDDPALMGQLPKLLLENLYSALDVLVDARISVYSKVLQSHAIAMAQSNTSRDNSQRQAIEFKLQSLLEIGTHLSASGISTSFSVPAGAIAKVQEPDGRVTLPIILQAKVHELAIPNPGLDSSSPDAYSPLSLAFSTAGRISGTFSQNNNDEHNHNSGAAMMQLSSLSVDVDSDALISSMMHEAAKVVSAVIDATNASWDRHCPVATLIPPSSTDEEEFFLNQQQQLVSPDLSASDGDGHEKLPAFQLDADHSHSQETHTSNHSERELPPSIVHVTKMVPRNSSCCKSSSLHRTQHYADLESLSDCEESSHNENGSHSVTNIIDYVMGEIDQSLLRSPARFAAAKRSVVATASGGSIGRRPLKKRRIANHRDAAAY